MQKNRVSLFCLIGSFSFPIKQKDYNARRLCLRLAAMAEPKAKPCVTDAAPQSLSCFCFAIIILFVLPKATDPFCSFLKHSEHIRTRLKRRVFGIMLFVVLAGRQPAFVLRTKFCSKTPSFQVAEFYRTMGIWGYARQKRRKS